MKIKKLFLITIFVFASVGSTVGAFAACYGGPMHLADSTTCNGQQGGCWTNKIECPPTV